MTQPTPDLPTPLSGPCTGRPHPKDPQRKLREQYAVAMHKALRDYGEGETDPGTGSDYGDQAAVALAVRDEEMDRLRAKVAEIDHIINWHTTCASCARILDSAYADTRRAETAEADLNACRDRYAVAADNAVQEIRRLEADLVAARSTIDRVRAAADALATQAADFTSHHNPACECSWGEALDQAAARIRAALNPPRSTGLPVHLAKGTNVEDCPACRVGSTPDYPWICPGPAVESTEV